MTMEGRVATPPNQPAKPPPDGPPEVLSHATDARHEDSHGQLLPRRRTGPTPANAGRWTPRSNGAKPSMPRRVRRFLRKPVVWVLGVVAASVAAVVPVIVEKKFLDAPPPAPRRPFSINASVSREYCNGAAWMIDKPPGQFPGPSTTGGDLGAWAGRIGAVPADTRDVVIVVQGTSEAAVTITGLRTRVVQRSVPGGGTRLSLACGGQGAYRWILADLDQNPPRQKPGYESTSVSDRIPLEARRPIAFPYTVSLSDPETFVVTGVVKRYDVRWVIDLSWVSGGHSGTETIDDNGHPFRLTATRSATASCGWLPDGEPIDRCPR